MYKLLKPVLASFFVTLLTISALAQAQKITGTVADNKGTRLEGVTVKLTSNKAAVATNKNGEFSLNAKMGETLEFSSIGFETKKLPLRVVI